MATDGTTCDSAGVSQHRAPDDRACLVRECIALDDRLGMEPWVSLDTGHTFAFPGLGTRSLALARGVAVVVVVVMENDEPFL